MAILLTKAAIKKVREQAVEFDLDLATTLLRFGVTGGGCSGLAYRLEFTHTIDPGDREPFEIEGIKIVIDKKSYLYVVGSTIDYVADGLSGGFIFRNPNAQSSCGCGQSFHPET